MDLKTIIETNFSNSGKSKRVYTFVTDGVNRFCKHISSEITENTLKRNTTLAEERTPTEDEVAFFNNELERYEFNLELAQNEVKKVEAQRVKLLNREIIKGIKLSCIYDDVTKKLQSNGDHTEYSTLEIALVCLHKLGLIELEWVSENDYNYLPCVLNDVLVRDCKNTDTYYIIKNNVAKIKIEAKESQLDFYKIDVFDFDFSIELLETTS